MPVFLLRNFLPLVVFFSVPNLDHGGFGFDETEPSAVVIRESTIDIQVRADEHLFVFSKSGGILEKVKIGMDVIYFSQQKLAENGSAGWKRLKNGDVQIFTSNDGKHQVWTIHSSGRLKMEALAKEDSNASTLSFEFSKSQLTGLRWIGDEKSETVLSYPGNQEKIALPLQTPNIDYVVLEFQSVKLKVTPESKPVDLMLHDFDLASLRFEKKISQDNAKPTSETPNFQSEKISNSSSDTSLVLWFDFNGQ